MARAERGTVRWGVGAGTVPMTDAKARVPGGAVVRHRQRLTDPRINSGTSTVVHQQAHGKAAGSDGDAAPCARCSKKKSRRLHWPANTRARLTVGATATCRREGV